MLFYNIFGTLQNIENIENTQTIPESFLLKAPSIKYGNALSMSDLSTASNKLDLPGTYVWEFPSTKPNVGINQIFPVKFIPNDKVNSKSININAVISIIKVPKNFLLKAPSINYGDMLSMSDLSTAPNKLELPGKYIWKVPSYIPPNVGTIKLPIIFTPDDTNTSIDCNAEIKINKGTLYMSNLLPPSIINGQSVSVSDLSNSFNDINKGKGSYKWKDPSYIPPNAGKFRLPIIFTPTDMATYIKNFDSIEGIAIIKVNEKPSDT